MLRAQVADDRVRFPETNGPLLKQRHAAVWIEPEKPFFVVLPMLHSRIDALAVERELPDAPHRFLNVHGIRSTVDAQHVSVRERTNDLLVCRMRREELAGGRHVEIRELETGRDCAAAERPTAAGGQAGRLPASGVRRLSSARRARGRVVNRCSRVAVARVDRVELERAAAYKCQISSDQRTR